MSVTLMGTIMAATTGIVGASVIMLTLIALPTMLAAGYSKELSTGTIASAGTLGILIPPSIMLVIIGDLLTISVGTLFTAAIIPGLVLSLMYLIYRGLSRSPIPTLRHRSMSTSAQSRPARCCAWCCAASCRRPR